MIPQASVRQYRDQKRIVAATVAQSRAAWRLMQPDLDAAWPAVSKRLLRAVTVGQLAAARSGALYADEVLDELNIESDPFGAVSPKSLAGVASDGRPLDGLLAGALYKAKALVGTGVSPFTAIAGAGKWLDMAVQTQVQDSGRVASGVGAYSQRNVTRYTRMLVAPSCARCAVLAGKVFYTSEAFLRHPRCDCRNIPCDENTAGDLTTNADDYFHSLDVAQQDKIFTKAGAQAIRDGADLNQVVNARRGMYTTRGGLKATSMGITRRGAFGSSQTGMNPVTGARERKAKIARIMPEEIYRIAPSRDEALRLLKYYKYII